MFCNICQSDKEPLEIPRPDTPHSAKLECPVCGNFLGWKKKAKNKYKRPKNKYTAEGLGGEYCAMCLRSRGRLGLHETLLIHHIVEIQDGGEDEPDNIWIICTHCHALIHHVRKYLNENLLLFICCGEAIESDA